MAKPREHLSNTSIRINMLPFFDPDDHWAPDVFSGDDLGPYKNREFVTLGLKSYLQGAGQPTARKIVDYLGVTENTLNIRPATHGAYSGIFFADHKDKRVVVNVSMDADIRSQIVQQDSTLKRSSHPMVPGKIPEVIADGEFIHQGLKLAFLAESGFTQVRELNIAGGLIMQGNKVAGYEQLRLLVNSHPEMISMFVKLEEPETIEALSEMQKLVAEIFFKSGQRLLVYPRINAGDFISQGEALAVPDFDHDPVRLITLRANLLEPEKYAYTRLPGNNPFGKDSIFGIYHKIQPDNPNVVWTGSPEKCQKLLDFTRNLWDFAHSLSPRQKLVLAPLFYTEKGLEDPSRWQYWPAEAVVEGISHALEETGLSNDEIYRWWTQGLDSPAAALDELCSLLENNPEEYQALFNLLLENDGIALFHLGGIPYALKCANDAAVGYFDRSGIQTAIRRN